MTTPEVIDIAADDGTPLRIRKWAGPSRTCLLIHGFGDGAHVWDEFVASVGRYYTTYTIDLRGHGDSGWDPSGSYHIDTHVRDVLCVLGEICGGVPVAVVGHSLGAEIAVRVAVSAPGSVSSLVFVDYGPELNADVIDHAFQSFMDNVRYYESPDGFASILSRKLPLARYETLLKFATASLKPDKRGGFVLKCDPYLGRTTREGADAAAMWSMLARIRCPLQVIRGLGSAILPRRVAEEMVARLRDAQLASVDQAGHAVMIDNPEGFASAIMPFLKRQLIREPIASTAWAEPLES